MSGENGTFRTITGISAIAGVRGIDRDGSARQNPREKRGQQHEEAPPQEDALPTDIVELHTQPPKSADSSSSSPQGAAVDGAAQRLQSDSHVPEKHLDIKV